MPAIVSHRLLPLLFALAALIAAASLVLAASHGTVGARPGLHHQRAARANRVRSDEETGQAQQQTKRDAETDVDLNPLGRTRHSPALIHAGSSFAVPSTSTASSDADSIELGSFSSSLQLSAADVQPASLSAELNGHNLSAIAQSAAETSKHSWEHGTVAQMLLELYEPAVSVFGPASAAAAAASTSSGSGDGDSASNDDDLGTAAWTVFPSNTLPHLNASESPSLQFAMKHITLPRASGDLLGQAADAVTDVVAQLIHGDGSAGDPASLGVAAAMLGAASGTGSSKNSKKGNSNAKAYAKAAGRQLDHLLHAVPRWKNGAISHRESKAVIWADSLYMIPPFMAYMAVARNSTALLQQSVEQISLVRSVLRYTPAAPNAPGANLYRHIVGPEAQTLGLWTTGNAWATMGIVRVLATVQHWSPAGAGASNSSSKAAKTLSDYAAEIFDGVQQLSTSAGGTVGADGKLAGPAVDPANGLLRGYLLGGLDGVQDDAYLWPGELTGTAGLASAMYRHAVLTSTSTSSSPDSASDTKRFLPFADALRRAVFAALDPDDDTAAGPYMDPYAWWNKKTVRQSPEGQAFVAILGAAYRDCVGAGVCDTPAPAAAAN